MKPSGKIDVVITSIATLALVTAGIDSAVLSDGEIKDYIEAQLVNGCRPTVDICESDCKESRIDTQRPKECIPKKIIRADKQRVVNLYLELAEEQGVPIGNINDIAQMPHKLRDEFGKTKTLKEIKEPLSKLIHKI